MPAVLMVLSGADTWTMKDGRRHPTGFWVEEFMRPYRAFTAAGLKVTIATPRGGVATPDPLSLSMGYNNNDQADVDDQERFLEKMRPELGSTVGLDAVDPAAFDVIFVVGGHGPMQDLAVDPSIGRIFAAMLADPSKIIASVCHGAAAFLSAFAPDGSWLFRGRKLTGFSNEEENQATFAGNAPWLLEDRLKLAGAQYLAEPAWTPHVVIDGNLITGQQQVSAQKAAEAILERLKASSGAGQSAEMASA
jgi:putative intracellular protease/amidase